MRWAALLALLPPGCVSARYMERRVQEAKQDVEDQLTDCHLNLEREMRVNDARAEDERERKEGQKSVPAAQ